MINEWWLNVFFWYRIFLLWKIIEFFMQNGWKMINGWSKIYIYFFLFVISKDLLENIITYTAIAINMHINMHVPPKFLLDWKGFLHLCKVFWFGQLPLMCCDLTSCSDHFPLCFQLSCLVLNVPLWYFSHFIFMGVALSFRENTFLHKRCQTYLQKCHS